MEDSDWTDGAMDGEVDRQTDGQVTQVALFISVLDLDRQTRGRRGQVKVHTVVSFICSHTVMYRIIASHDRVCNGHTQAVCASRMCVYISSTSQ